MLAGENRMQINHNFSAAENWKIVNSKSNLFRFQTSELGEPASTQGEFSLQLREVRITVGSSNLDAVVYTKIMAENFQFFVFNF